MKGNGVLPPGRLALAHGQQGSVDPQLHPGDAGLCGGGVSPNQDLIIRPNCISERR